MTTGMHGKGADRGPKLSEIEAETGAGVNGAADRSGEEALPTRYHDETAFPAPLRANGPGVQVSVVEYHDDTRPETTTESRGISNRPPGGGQLKPSAKQDTNRTTSTGKPLSPRQALFVGEYLVDGNATRAAARAGYSARTAKQQGSRLLTVRWVSAAIKEAMERRAERVEIKQDDVLRELKVIAFAEPGEKYKASDKVKALDLLGKHLRMWADKPTDDGKVQIVIQREAPLPAREAMPFVVAKA